jgi:hypothetical protein
MSNRQVKILVQALMLVLLSVVASYGQLLGTACEPYGSVSIRNEPAADNVPVVAFIDGREVARCLTYGGQYSLFIALDDPDTPEKEGWADGDNIVIQVSGIEAYPSFKAQQGRIRVDLTVNTLGIKLDTWGKIKALFK